MANSSEQTFNLKLKIDSSAIFSNAKIQIFKEINKIRREAKSVGINISPTLDLTLKELKETLDEHSAEVMERIVEKCKKKSIALVDETKPAYDFPDDWDNGQLVTCKKCFFQWDGYAQHVCD